MYRLVDNPVSRTVLSVWAWLVLVVVIIVWTPMVAITRLATLRDPAAYRAGYLFRKLAVAHQRLNPLWTFEISGPMPADPRRPYVAVANHESFVDILLLSHLPFEMKWMSKSDFFRYPLVGWMMRLAGDIRLDRGDKGSGARALDECRDRLGKDVSVMIFPEGTRSRTGDLQPFKDGAFSLAVETGVPILPMAIVGTRDALVKHDWRFGRSDAEVRVLEPIEPGRGPDAIDDLRERTHAAIAAAIADLRIERRP